MGSGTPPRDRQSCWRGRCLANCWPSGCEANHTIISFDGFPAVLIGTIISLACLYSRHCFFVSGGEWNGLILVNFAKGEKRNEGQ
jgi:hypothetical protein